MGLVVGSVVGNKLDGVALVGLVVGAKVGIELDGAALGDAVGQLLGCANG